MRIRVDEERCSGHGRCYTVSPEVFEADDEGYPRQRGQEITIAPPDEEAARRGADNCPESAITISD